MMRPVSATNLCGGAALMFAPAMMSNTEIMPITSAIDMVNLRFICFLILPLCSLAACDLSGKKINRPGRDIMPLKNDALSDKAENCADQEIVLSLMGNKDLWKRLEKGWNGDF